MWRWLLKLLRHIPIFLYVDNWFRRLSEPRVPELASAQPESIGEILPYEGLVEHEGLTYVLLSDGSLGLAWTLDTTGHEALPMSQVASHAQSVVQALDGVWGRRTTVQFIWDSSPSSRFMVPGYVEAPTTYAQRMMVHRIRAVQKLAEGESKELPCMRRQLWLTLRLQRRGRLGIDERTRGFLAATSVSALRDEQERLNHDARTLREMTTLLEEGLRTSGVRAHRCNGNALLDIIRSTFHSIAATERGWLPHDPNVSFREQATAEFATCTQSALQVGDLDGDTLQVLSWTKKPVEAFEGMMAVLLRVPEPMRVVLNLRSCENTGDLGRAAMFLRFALDAVGKRQFQEVSEAQERLAHNQRLFYATLHIVVRNTRCSLKEVNARNVAGQVLGRVKLWMGMPLIHEIQAAPLIFRQCLPFGYQPESGRYTLRERRVFSGELSCYLPLWGGFPGCRNKSQIMLSRGAEPIYLSSRDSQTSQHIAVLASSGGGKSFWLTNYLVGDRALHPRSLDFIIDNKTSYEILARVIGEEGGCVLAKPPASVPNIFMGDLDEERLAVMVAVLRSAIVLASPKAELTAEHTMLLSDAIRKTFEANYIDSRTTFEKGRLGQREAAAVPLPRLSQVVDKFVEICQERDLPLEYASWMRAKLSPYVGKGPYANLFDREMVSEAEAPTPAITLIDLDGVSQDALLCTLVAQICIADIVRQVKRPENVGRVGRLVIEEAGVLGQQSAELVNFVHTAWKTFRKLNYACIGLTNEVDDYRLKPAPRTMWQVSPTKVILPMSIDERGKAATEDRVNGVPKLIANQHYLELIGTLAKREGRSSQGLWMGEGTGTFIYVPTGFDYWTAASKPVEVAAANRLAELLKGRVATPYWHAIEWLAVHRPLGFRDDDGEVRKATDEELKAAVIDVETEWRRARKEEAA
jgi:hypothetical protein